MDEKYVPPFKIGDYITGKDRTYSRSIYKYCGMNKDQTKVGIEFIAWGGRSFEYAEGKVEYFPNGFLKRYRLATRKELIASGVITQSIDFILNN